MGYTQAQLARIDRRQTLAAKKARGDVSPDTSPLRLRLSPQERRGLAWLCRWSRGQITHMKVRRKYRPREAVMDPREMATFEALISLEKSVQEILKANE